MKPTNKEIKALDQYGHTIYLNLSDCVAVYFQDAKPHHVRFWSSRVPKADFAWTTTWAQSTLRAMGWETATLGEWREQDIDAPVNDGLVSKVTF